MFKKCMIQTVRCFIVMTAASVPVLIEWLFLNYNGISTNLEDILKNYIMTGNILFVGISLLIITAADTVVFKEKIDSLKRGRGFINVSKVVIFLFLLFGMVAYTIITTSKGFSESGFAIARNITYPFVVIGMAYTITVNTILEGEVKTR